MLTSVDGTSQTVSIVPDETGSFAADSLNWGYEAQIRTDDSMDTAEMAAGLSAQLTAEFTFDQSDNSFCLRLPDARFSTDDGADGYTAEAVYWNTASVTVRAIGTKDGAEITSDRAQWILLEYGVEGSNSFEGKNENGLNLRSLADGESWSSAVSNADYFVVKRAEAPIRITAYTPGLLLEMPEEETEEWES